MSSTSHHPIVQIYVLSILFVVFMQIQESNATSLKSFLYFGDENSVASISFETDLFDTIHIAEFSDHSIAIDSAMNSDDKKDIFQLDPPRYVRVQTKDGNILFGDLISETDQAIIIRTSSGDVTIMRENIQRITDISRNSIRDGKFWHPNPQSTRYLFSPNALGLKKGEGYYQNVWIFFNNANYGLTDNFSLGAGLVPSFLFGASETPIWILPKFSVPIPNSKFHIAAGAMLGGITGVASFGVLYGMATYGDQDHNMSVGLGYGYAEGEVSSSPVVTFSGMFRASHRVYFITENYIFPDTEGLSLVSFGMRWAPENFAVDFAIMSPVGEDLGRGFIGFPWLGVTIPFGR